MQTSVTKLEGSSKVYLQDIVYLCMHRYRNFSRGGGGFRQLFEFARGAMFEAYFCNVIFKEIWILQVGRGGSGPPDPPSRFAHVTSGVQLSSKCTLNRMLDTEIKLGFIHFLVQFEQNKLFNMLNTFKNFIYCVTTFSRKSICNGPGNKRLRIVLMM